LEEDHSPNWYFSAAGSAIGGVKAQRCTNR